MHRRDFSRRTGFGLLAALSALVAAPARAAPAESAATGKDDAGKNRVVIQVSTEDRHTQGLALGNAHNYAAYFRAKNEPFEIAIVAFGPGFNMLRADLSMVKGEVENLIGDLGSHLTVYACQNSRDAIAESEGKKPGDIPELNGVKDTPSGIVKVAELQQAGWSYVRP